MHNSILGTTVSLMLQLAAGVGAAFDSPAAAAAAANSTSTSSLPLPHGRARLQTGDCDDRWRAGSTEQLRQRQRNTSITFAWMLFLGLDRKLSAGQLEIQQGLSTFRASLLGVP